MIVVIKDVLYNTPPELSADVMEKEVIPSGGSSQLRNLAHLFSESTGVPAYMADAPSYAWSKEPVARLIIWRRTSGR